ncbi:MAG: transposase domain-containing protein [Streptomyces sp.]|nr:transposase domain-containing protein [Streptomyces sp.]
MGQVKGEGGPGLPDRVMLGLLARAFPPELVDRAVAECGRAGQRDRLLPPRTVVYFVIAMCLFPGLGYAEVARLVTDGLAWAGQPGPRQVPTSAAVSRARARLGPEPLRILFRRVARPLATLDTRGAWYGRRRLVALDSAVLDVPGSAENTVYFGCPLSRRARQGVLPQVRVMALTECGTGAVTAAAPGPPAVPELVPARELFGRIGPGDLLLAEPGPSGPALWRAAAATGADLLWRVPFPHTLRVGRELPDGSYLSATAGQPGADPVRVVACLPGGPAGRAPCLLATTLLDHRTDPAPGLAALHGPRHGSAYAPDPPRPRPYQPAGVLRSRLPGGVEQEVWGHLLAHHAVHAFLHDGAGGAFPLVGGVPRPARRS